jgi:transcriptional regulator with XRE-family HTH domain
MGVKEVFSQRLKILREENGLSQSQLADKLGISRGSISYYENCDRTPDIEILAKTQKYFNVTTDYLLGFDDNRNKESFKNLNQQLEDFGELINGSEYTEGILNGLIWILLLPNILKKEKKYSSESIDMSIRCLRQLISCMGHAAMLAINLSEKSNLNINLFSDYGSLLNSVRKITNSSLNLYFCELMDIAVTHARDSIKVDYSESTDDLKSASDLLSIENMYSMFMGNFDFDKMKEDMESGSKLLLELLPPITK